MRGKLAALVAFCPWLLFGCGLDTSGSGPDGDDQGPSDVPAEEAGPDIMEDDAAEPDHFELALEDVSPEETEEAGPDETEETADSTADSAEAEDAGPEDESDAEDGADEDGEVTDPCAPPDIPSVGLYLWYCIPDPPVSINMGVGRQVERLSEPLIVWAWEPTCWVRDTRFLFCELVDYGPGSTYYFNITTPGIDAGWSCGPGLEVTHGFPRIWRGGHELEVGVADNTYGGCNHTFEIAPL